MIAPTKKRRLRHSTLVHPRAAVIFEALLLVSGGFGLVMSPVGLSLWVHAAWTGVAALYMAIVWRHLVRAAGSPSHNAIQHHPQGTTVGVWGGTLQLDILIVVTASMMGIATGILLARHASDAQYIGLNRVLAGSSILLAWALLHVGFARMYIDVWHQRDTRGLDFPNTQEPGFVEFHYYAFTVGVTYQTSDVSVTNSRMRMLTISHSMLSFLYTTVMLGFVISLIPGA